MKSPDIEQWDRYWAYGNLHSFSQVAGGNYEGAVSDFWRTRFARLASKSRILDVATGNGAIPLLALEVSDEQDKGFVITGTDLADIDPAASVADGGLREKLKRLDFRGRTPAESLPLPDVSVDLACSQFGLEYSDLPKSLAELARVLKPGGSLAFVAHHRHSLLLAATRRELEQLEFVLNDVKLYLRARNLLRAMSDAARGGKSGRQHNAKLAKKQRALQEALARIQEAAGQASNPNMLLGPARYVQEILAVRDRKSPAELLDWLDEASRRVLANRRRLTDMAAAAMDAEEMHWTARRLGGLGLTDVETGELARADGSLIGWRVEARKDA